ncbi:MAG: ATP-binding protein, partial [Chloroflexota bacterium]|nr:ATP-binding protein [Chloroflexota bacterium]
GGQVWAAGRPLRVDDYATWAAAVPGVTPLHAMVGIPLMVGPALRGVIGLAHLDATRTFSPLDVDRLTRFAQLAALVLTYSEHDSGAHQEIEERRRIAAAMRAALAGVEQRNRQLADILLIGNAWRLNRSLESMLQEMVAAVSTSLGFQRVVFNLREGEGSQVRVCAYVGLAAAAQQTLAGAVYPWTAFAGLLREPFRQGRCYLIPQGSVDWERDFAGPVYLDTPPAGATAAAANWQVGDALLVPVELRGGQIAGVLSLDHPLDGRRPTAGTLRILEIFANQAAGAIENARLYGRLQADLLERQRVAEELATAKEAAEVANRAKSAFLSLVSHELRTPLNAILGFAQILELHDLAPRPRESVGYILQGGRHLLTLVDTVLDITSSESGELPLLLEPLPLWPLVQASLELMQPLASQRAVELQAEHPPADLPLIHADRRRLQQVLLNLLSNAITYNQAGGRVTVACRQCDPQSLCCTVHDTGRGIAPDHLGRLFVPFDRLGAEQTAVAGTGLALTLTKRLVEAMAGRLEVESVVGQGSAFSVILPLAPRAERVLGPALALGVL